VVFGVGTICIGFFCTLLMRQPEREFQVRLTAEGCKHVAELAFWLATLESGDIIIIGANEGDTDSDPVFRHLRSKEFDSYRKIFVEPVPFLAARLQKNIESMPNSKVVNAAISDAKNLTLHCYDLEKLADVPKWKGNLRYTPKWFLQICSESLDRLRHPYDVGADPKRLDAAKSVKIKSFTVPALTVKELISRYELHSVRYVQIDVEGFDDKVLFMLPFGAPEFQPTTIVFEHVLLPDDRYAEALALLSTNSYATCKFGQNTFAIKVPTSFRLDKTESVG